MTSTQDVCTARNTESSEYIYCLRGEQEVRPNSDRDTKDSFIDRRDHYIWVLKHGKELNSEIKKKIMVEAQVNIYPILN